ncbi:MAG TPA: hypothetical protein VFH14_11995 [Gemmatimonadaceae bacterium]|jgi:hypothetical protein|nr:hypothetical protein [Gemmatimonadaceae bacterium]
MKAYVTTTGVIFALLTVVHVWRAIEEGPGLAAQPAFILATVVSAAFAMWAVRVLRHTPRS